LYLIGPRSLSVNLPMESPPARFPDEAAVIVIGCAVEAGDIDAVAIAIRGASPAWYFSEPVPSPVCPPSGTRPDTGTSAPGGQARSTEAISAAQNRR
jgi:hypothetical protein